MNKKFLTVTLALALTSTFSYHTVKAQGSPGIGMNSTTSYPASNSLSTSGAYGTSVASGTGSKSSTMMGGGYSPLISPANNVNQSSYHVYENTNTGTKASNWGWLGLLGLLGFAGRRGSNKSEFDAK